MRPTADRKPRVAIVSPWPPQGSGVADYAARMAGLISREYEVDACHDSGCRPEPGAYTPVPTPLMGRLRPLRPYRNVLYQMGNSPAHSFLYPLMLERPGVVTLHDLRLGHFHEAFGERAEVPPRHLEREVAHDRPGEATEIMRAVPAMRRSPGGVGGGLAALGIDMNRRVIERSRAVVVHSLWARDRARSLVPDHARKIVRIPFPASVEPPPCPDRRKAICDRLGLPREAVVFAALGFLSPLKMNEETIEAFAIVAREHPKLLLVFAGQDLGGGRAEQAARRHGIEDRVRFLGRRSAEDFHDLASSCHVGINLRRAPTTGETSAALLDLMRWGVPTIVTDADAFADEPEDAVVRVRWGREGMSGLVREMRRLASEPSVRRRIGDRSREHLLCHHRPGDVAATYIDLIERTAPARHQGAA